MSKNKWLLVSVLSVAAGVGVAAAQPGHPERFAKLDTNGDGAVTTAEFEAHILQRWTEADANKDSKVTADEMKARFEAHKQERLKERDTNGNGVLERSEVAKMPDALFTKLDADKSGTLTPAEMKAGKEKGCGHEGKGFRGEGKRLPGDANEDGVVTKEEARTGAQQLAKHIDANGDGKLTQDELGRGRGHHFGGRGHGRGHGHGAPDAE